MRTRIIALDKPDGASRSGASELAPEVDRVRPAIEGAVRCARCGATVALEKDRTAAFGGHEHDRVNPAGYSFRIALFAEAAGAVAVEPASDEFAWFPRYAWRPAICAACRAHLGWHFVGAEGSFFGLIVTAITRA